MEASRDSVPQRQNANRRESNIISSFCMALVILLCIAVVVAILIPREPGSIVIQSTNTGTNFDATSALLYAERVSRVAEFTVGGILSLALALVAFNWFANSSRIQAEREELANHKQTLESSLSQSQSRFETETNSRLDQYKSTELSLTKRMDTIRIDIEALVENRTEQIRRTVEEEVSQFRIDQLRALYREVGPEGYERARVVIDAMRSEGADAALAAVSETLPPLCNALEARPSYKSSKDVADDLITFFWSIKRVLIIIRSRSKSISESTIRNSQWPVSHGIHYVDTYLRLYARPQLSSENFDLLKDCVDLLIQIREEHLVRFPDLDS